HGVTLRPVGVELSRTAAREARALGLAALLADGGALPIRPRSVDVVLASQVLHHLPRDVAVRWIASLIAWHAGRWFWPTCGARASPWRASGSRPSRSASGRRRGATRWCRCGEGTRNG